MAGTLTPRRRSTRPGSLSRRPVDHLRHDPTSPVRHVDWVLLVTTVAIAVVGMAAIYSARWAELNDRGIDPFTFVARQGIALAVGGVGMAVVAAVDYRRWRDFAPALYGLNCLLLVAVLGLGKRVNGAQAWFDLGPFQLQPAEVMKVTLVLTLAAFCAQFGGRMQARHFVAALAILSLPAGLTMLQPDLGTTVVFCSIAMGVLLVAGARTKHIVAVTLLGMVVAVGAFNSPLIRQYQEDRLTSFLALSDTAAVAAAQRNDAAYQQRNSTIAISLGGMTGEGWLEGSQTNNQYIPERHNDFIFSVVGEQFGLVGGAVVIGLFVVLCIRLWRIAALSRDLLGTLISVGILAMVAFQVFQNVGMAMGIMPITGIPLPMVSYGGSAVIGFLALMGLAQNVHMRRWR